MPPLPTSKASSSKVPASDRGRSATGKAQHPKENTITPPPPSTFSFAKGLVKDKDRANQKYALPDLLKQERKKVVSQWEANGGLKEKQGADRARKPVLGDLHCKMSFKDWVARTPLDGNREGGIPGRK